MLYIMQLCIAELADDNQIVSTHKFTAESKKQNQSSITVEIKRL